MEHPVNPVYYSMFPYVAAATIFNLGVGLTFPMLKKVQEFTLRILMTFAILSIWMVKSEMMSAIKQQLISEDTLIYFGTIFFYLLLNGILIFELNSNKSPETSSQHAD